MKKTSFALPADDYRAFKILATARNRKIGEAAIEAMYMWMDAGAPPRNSNKAMPILTRYRQ